MVTFQIEKLSDVKDEVLPLLHRHWDEIALNKETVPLNPDWDTYAQLEGLGMLHVTTARADGTIVGYASYLLTPNLHYRTMLVADCDIFYLAPEHRKGATGIKLLREAEANILVLARADARAFDCAYILTKEKAHFQKDGKQVVGRIMARLGYSLIEHLHAKRVSLA